MHVNSNWPLRSVALAVALAAVLGAAPGIAAAQDYPSQDIRLICGFPPGSGADVFVRYFAEKLRPITGRTVVVENKVGAASNIATEYVARSKPDGHTLYPFTATTVAASMHLFKHPPVDVGKAIRVAATTSSLMIGVTAAASAPLYYAAGDIPPTYAAASVLGVMMGTRAGFWIAARASSQWLKILLGLVLVFVAVMMLVRA